MNVVWCSYDFFWILICSNIFKISEMNLRFLEWFPFVNRGTNWNSEWFPSFATAHGNEEIASKSQGNHEWKIRRKKVIKISKTESWWNRIKIMSIFILKTSPKILQRTFFPALNIPKWSQVSVYRIGLTQDQKQQTGVSIFKCNADCIFLQDHEPPLLFVNTNRNSCCNHNRKNNQNDHHHHHHHNHNHNHNHNNNNNNNNNTKKKQKVHFQGTVSSATEWNGTKCCPSLSPNRRRHLSDAVPVNRSSLGRAPSTLLSSSENALSACDRYTSSAMTTVVSSSSLGKAPRRWGKLCKVTVSTRRFLGSSTIFEKCFCNSIALFTWKTSGRCSVFCFEIGILKQRSNKSVNSWQACWARSVRSTTTSTQREPHCLKQIKLSIAINLVFPAPRQWSYKKVRLARDHDSTLACAGCLYHNEVGNHDPKGKPTMMNAQSTTSMNNN